MRYAIATALLAALATTAWAEPRFGIARPQSLIQPVNMICGFKPFAPLGCQVGACVCDQNGNNCQWQMICR
jgi:hypothetical protein